MLLIAIHEQGCDFILMPVSLRIFAQLKFKKKIPELLWTEWPPCRECTCHSPAARDYATLDAPFSTVRRAEWKDTPRPSPGLNKESRWTRTLLTVLGRWWAERAFCTQTLHIDKRRRTAVAQCSRNAPSQDSTQRSYLQSIQVVQVQRLLGLKLKWIYCRINLPTFSCVH